MTASEHKTDTEFTKYGVSVMGILEKTVYVITAQLCNFIVEDERHSDYSMWQSMADMAILFAGKRPGAHSQYKYVILLI